VRTISFSLKRTIKQYEQLGFKASSGGKSSRKAACRAAMGHGYQRAERHYSVSQPMHGERPAWIPMESRERSFV